jgi:hypothetical protein
MQKTRVEVHESIMTMLRLAAIAAIAIAVLACRPAVAGPPFLTDDPEPVPLHHWELYTFGTWDRTRGADTVAAPALEVNNGIARSTQLHLIVPNAYFSQAGMSASGIGDIETGVKYRFIEQTKLRPDIGVFPLVDLPTGDASKGLGTGRVTAKLPIWLEKDRGQWTTYFGGGYAINPVPGLRNYWYGGDLVQKTVSPTLSLGAEVFLQGASADQAASTRSVPTVGARSSALWNAGGQYNFTTDLSLLFSAGHSFQGEGNTVVYLALYRTWGLGAP